MSKESVVEEIIKTIEVELKQSSQTRYVCIDESVINTDVGYVEDWFNEYKHVLRERY